MFQKEQSLQGRKKKAVDVPVRKSDRRKLLERAKRYFDAVASVSGDADADADGNGNGNDNDNDSRTVIDSILDATFLQGNLSARSLPMEGGKAWNMLLYLKTPSANDDQADSPSVDWAYSTSSQFVWMALEEKGKVVRETPTVAMWAVVVSALPQFLTKQNAVWVPSAVSKYVCRGADLMRAGMRTLPQANDVEMAPILVQGNPQPFAVGQVKSPQEPIGVGITGIGVLIWNAYGDDMWRFSNTKMQRMGEKHYNQVGGQPMDNGNYGNIGFQEGKWVVPIVDSPENADTTSSDEDVEEDHIVQDGDAIGEGIGEQAAKVVGNDSNTSSSPEKGTENPPPIQKDAQEPLSPDQILHQSVLRALLTLQKKDLPIPVGTFYAQHVIPNRPDGTTIDLKATTYKKFGSYLKLQMERGLLQVGADKSNPRNTDPVAILIGYDKKHDDLKGIEKPVKDSTADPTLKTSKLVLVNLYTIPSNWKSLLALKDDDVSAANATSEERRGAGMLTTAEARKILEDYIAREELVPPTRPDQVTLDGPLTEIFYKKQNDTPERLLRKDLVKQLTTKLSPAYALVAMPGSKITKLAKGTPPKIEIEVSRRQSNKFVTRVRGLEDYGIDAAYFSKDVAKRLACSASIETAAAPGRAALRKSHVELIFQGNVVNEIEALLVDESLSNHGGVKGSEYSVPKEVIDVKMKKGVPGRKKGGRQNK